MNAEIAERRVSTGEEAKTPRRIRWLDLAIGGVIVMLLSLGALVILAPIAWMLSTSVKAAADVFLFPPVWIPNPIHWENYYQAHFGPIPFILFYRNTAMYVALVMTGQLLSCSLVAYGFARLRAPAKNALFILVLSTMMLPGQVTMIPQYLLFRGLGWVGTYLPLVVPAYFGAPFYIFQIGRAHV